MEATVLPLRFRPSFCNRANAPAVAVVVVVAAAAAAVAAGVAAVAVLFFPQQWGSGKSKPWLPSSIEEEKNTNLVYFPWLHFARR